MAVTTIFAKGHELNAMIDLDKLSNYKENSRLEAKKAAGGLPHSIWETYSAFANTNGGVILLGVEENADKTLRIAGLENPEKLVVDFWNSVNNSNKVSVNILKDKNVQIAEYRGQRIVSIEIPRAERMDRPIYLNNDMWKAYRRNGEGDYCCSKASVRAMLRDSGNETQDMLVLEKMPFSVFDYDTVRGYRNVMRITHPSHVWDDLDNDDFLLKLGAIGRGDDEKLHPTSAGLLMFGFEHEIVREYPHYFLDYQEHFDQGLRWTDRLTSASGEWSGNLFGFYYKAYNKLIQNPNVKVPFKIENGFRVDDTPVHKALREALANCLVNADYYGEGGVVIKNHSEEIILENPGSFRLQVAEAISGGFSTPRNSILMKMFNLLDIGERAGSGIPNIYRVWEKQNYKSPRIEERLDQIERICLTLPMTTQKENE
ncbi:MAG: putative DNA binding domain-containing protein [Clostridiales bacterium]|nr:putative DNA binding domain-containing protein [Clostridiales bacterium]